MQWRTLENISVVCLFRVVDFAQKKKKKWGWEGLTPKPHNPPPPAPLGACAWSGTVYAAIYEVDNTKNRSEPLRENNTCVASVPE